ncbi:MAG TPA: alpha/beta fold hydrolase [Xanthobacteraceae bacterium]|jgi:thioesterase domain-containing protein/acyl carrier protein|nr:alpha/beta fold hydrolase [Xanthobacteraceae bacterium]
MSARVHLPPSPAATAESVRLLRREEIDPGTDYVPPSTPLEIHLARIWEDILTIDKVGISDDFFELGGDSLQAVELFVRVEKALGAVLSPSTIIDYPNVAQLARLLAGDATSVSTRSLVPLQAEGAEPPLFFVHEASGNLLSYRELVQHLGARRKIFGLQYPFQDQDPIPALSIAQMATIYVESIKSVQADGPYCLVGYSLGGTVAYEIARQLRARGDQIGLLVLIDSGNRDGLVRGLQRLARKLSWHLAILSEQRPSAWARYCFRALDKEAGRVEADLAEKLRESRPMLPVKLHALMSDTLMSALEDYPAPASDVAIKLLRSNGLGARWSKRALGWADRAQRGVEVFDVPADHYAVISEPTVALVAAHMRQWLDDTEKKAGR